MGSDGRSWTFEEAVEWTFELGGHPVKAHLFSSEGQGSNAEIVGRLTRPHSVIHEHPHPRQDHFFQVGDDGSWFCVSSRTFQSAHFGIVDADDPDGLWIEHKDGSRITIVPEESAEDQLGVIRAES